MALGVALDESTLPHLFGVACNLHWGEVKPAAQQWGMAAASFHLGTAPQVAVLAPQPQPAVGKHSLTLAHSKRQMWDRHCSPPSFKHWGSSCWKQQLDAPAVNISEMEGSTREWDYQCSAKFNPSLLSDWHFLALKLLQSSLWGSKHRNNRRTSLCMGPGRKCQDFCTWLTGKLTCLTKTAWSLVVHGNN